MTALITAARESLWAALDHDAGLADPGSPTGRVFLQTFRMDDEAPLLQDIVPALSDLPALAILPASISPVLWLNGVQQWPLVLEITQYTADWRLSPAETLIEKVITACYQSAPAGSSIPFVKAATGFYPQRLGPISFTPTRVGRDRRLKVIQTRLMLALRLQAAPYG